LQTSLLANKWVKGSKIWKTIGASCVWPLYINDMQCKVFLELGSNHQTQWGLTNVDYQQWDYEVKNVKMKWFGGVLVTKIQKKSWNMYV
jgi:hypothetical protein